MVNGISFNIVNVTVGKSILRVTDEQGCDIYDEEKLVHFVSLSDFYR